MNSSFRYEGYWIPFPHPVPAVVGSAWDSGALRTICVSEEWLPYILGALSVLARRETYYGDHADIEFSVEQANHILASWRDECPMPIQFRQTLPCLLEYSTDGGIVWTGAYNGQQCINANIADGTLQAGTTANPSMPVATGGCIDYHIQVQETTDFLLPTTVSTGDVITISEVSGEWADGWLGNLWYCYDGSSFVLGICIGGSNPAKAGDPLNTAQHQQLIMKVGSTYIDILAGAYTVPGGVSNAQVSFLPNNGSARSGGTGVVRAKVTVCNNSSWCHYFNFVSGDQSFTAFNYAGLIRAAYSAGNGWTQNLANGLVQINSPVFPSSGHVQRITYHWNTAYNTGVNAQYPAASAPSGTNLGGASGNHQDFVINCDATFSSFWTNFDTGSGTSIAGKYLQSIKLEGIGANPWGSNNCP